MSQLPASSPQRPTSEVACC
uniref:Uncharacterized protein n=1 Tax=Arundo donax TaxID=35708 RepID=A0A0A9GTA0_ARUDO